MQHDEPRRLSTPERRRLAERVLDGYVSGPEAATEATVRALARIDHAVDAVVLVEGVSDQIAVEAVARRLDRDLDAEGVVVVPVGGAQAFGASLLRFGPRGENRLVAGLCDAAEEAIVAAGVRSAGIGDPRSSAEMAALGFHVCIADLEDELIRAAGMERIEALLAQNGDLGSFRRMQHQPAWRGRAFDSQMRRFLGAGARRKLRYARLLVEAIDVVHLPGPLRGVLAAVSARERDRRT